MAQLDPSLAAEMRRTAQDIRERQAAGNFTKSWPLSGKKSIVEPGRDVIVRLLPRWDIADSMMGAAGARVPNPAYKGGRMYVIATEHWWYAPDGKRVREFCPRTLDEKAQCCVCDAAQELTGSSVKEDRDVGKDIGPKVVYIFNAAVGNPRKVGDDGLVDIRVISCTPTVYFRISDIMTGGERTEFARGDVTNPKEGYDLIFKRPAKDSGERWMVDAVNPSGLYAQAQAGAFKGWATRLINLEDMLEKETKDSDGIYKAYYGRTPDADTKAPAKTAPPAETAGGGDDDYDPAAVGAGAAAESSQEPVGPDDEYMPPAANAQPPAQQAPKGVAPRVARPRR